MAPEAIGRYVPSLIRIIRSGRARTFLGAAGTRLMTTEDVGDRNGYHGFHVGSTK